MSENQFQSPRTLEAALHLLQQHGEAAAPLAGGSDLIVQMKSGLRRPEVVVDLKHVPELTALEIPESGGDVIIGAARSTAQLRETPELWRLFPGLMEAAERIGSEQIQARASLGGNLCNASPAADTTPALIALNAVCEIAGPEGRREIPVAQFSQGPGKTVLARGELLAALHIPIPQPRSADASLRFIPRTEMDIAVVAVGARITLNETGECTDACLALGAVGPTAFAVPEARAALLGKAADEAALQAAAQAASTAAQPISDKRGTAEYRKHIAGVLARRALATAAQRAAQSAANPANRSA